MLNDAVKKILQVFFIHPIGGLVVKDEKKEKFLGIIQKERVMDFLNFNISAEDKDVELLKTILLPIDENNIKQFYNQINPVPIITLTGDMLGFVEKEKLLMISKPKVAIEEKQQEDASKEQIFKLLNYVGLPVLVVNKQKSIDFANQSFLSLFGFEPQFILTQNLLSFFPKIKVQENGEGALTYSHKQWKYKIQYNVEFFFIVFWQLKNRQNYDFASEMKKLLNGSETLDSLVKKYENKIIDKVGKKTKGNTKLMARWLGVQEEILIMKMNRKRK